MSREASEAKHDNKADNSITLHENREEYQRHRTAPIDGMVPKCSNISILGFNRMRELELHRELLRAMSSMMAKLHFSLSFSIRQLKEKNCTFMMENEKPFFHRHILLSFTKHVKMLGHKGFMPSIDGKEAY